MDEKDDDTPDLVDALFGQLRLAETMVSIQMNGFIRDQILLALVRGGLMTKDELSASLDSAEKEIADMAVEVGGQQPDNKFRAELLERMKEKAKGIADHIRKEVIEPSS
jgi:hypothetical protein